MCLTYALYAIIYTPAEIWYTDKIPLMRRISAKILQHTGVTRGENMFGVIPSRVPIGVRGSARGSGNTIRG